MNKTILASLIGSGATILAAFIGVNYGKSNAVENVLVQLINEERLNGSPVNIVNSINNQNNTNTNEEVKDQTKDNNKNVSEDISKGSSALVDSDMPTTINLMDTNVLYDGVNYEICKNSGENSFNVGGVTYSSGFNINTRGGKTGSALFNLKKDYSAINFNVGRVDGTELHDATIEIWLDGKRYETYEISSTIPNTPIEIDLKNVGSMEIKLNIKISAWTSYGFTDIYLKK